MANPNIWVVAHGDSFIFGAGEHELVSMPDISQWANRYGA